MLMVMQKLGMKLPFVMNSANTHDSSVDLDIYVLQLGPVICREGFLVSVAKSLKRVGGVSGSSSPNISSEHENLEDSMRKVGQL